MAICSFVGRVVDWACGKYYGEGYEAWKVIQQDASKLTRLYKKDKNLDYYFQVKKVVDDCNFQASRFDISHLKFNPDILRDIESIKEVYAARVYPEPMVLEATCRTILERGVPIQVVHEIAGDKCNVHLLHEETRKQLIDEYVGLYQQRCVTCLNNYTKKDFQDRRIHQTFCHHYVHAECMLGWIASQKARDNPIEPSCQSCRHTVDFVKDRENWQATLDVISPEVNTKLGIKSKKKVNEIDMSSILATAEEERKKARAEQILGDSALAHQLAAEMSSSSLPA